MKTYYILFTIDSDFSLRGVKLESIINELNERGEVLSISNELDDQGSKTWEVFISGNIELSDLEDVFIFMSDIVKIESIGEGNLLMDSEFNSIIKKNSTLKKQNDLSELLTIGKKIKNEAIQKISKTEIKQDFYNNSHLDFLKVPAKKLDEQMDFLSELVTAKAELRLIVSKEKYKKLNKLVDSIDKITNNLRKNILNVRLVQVQIWYDVFYRLIRDISKKLNKEVELIAEGLDTEIDKNIIDSLEGPLSHLIRNSIDHGIELPDEREKKGKPRKGTILLKAGHSGAYIQIEIKDDGGGIDIGKIRQKALNMGLINQESILSDKQIYELIFLPGFSTAQSLSQISGRGVGMDVVKKAIKQQRGEIDITSVFGKGTNVIIKLPVLLSILDTLLTRIANQYFAIPIPVIYKCHLLTKYDIELSDNNLLNIENELIPYIDLREKYFIKENPPENQKLVIIKQYDEYLGLIVDEVIGEYQAVLKPLDGYFINQHNFIGASLLADGNLCLILDTSKLTIEKTKETVLN